MNKIHLAENGFFSEVFSKYPSQIILKYQSLTLLCILLAAHPTSIMFQHGWKKGGKAIPAPLTTSAYSFLLKTFKFGKSVYLA